MPPFRNPMTGRFETNPYEQAVDYQQAQFQYQNQLQQRQMQYLSQIYGYQAGRYLYNMPYLKTEEQIKAERERAEKARLYAELADPNSPLYDPLLCLKNGVEYKAPEKKKGTPSTGPR